MSIYIILNLKKLIFYEDDSINLENQQLDLETLSEVSYKNSKLFKFYTIRKQKGTLPVYFDQPEIQRYVNVTFLQRRDDWFKKEGEGRFTFT
jgi:hypothetical protein